MLAVHTTISLRSCPRRPGFVLAAGSSAMWTFHASILAHPFGHSPIKREEADLSEYNDCGFSQTDWTFHRGYVCD